MFDVVGFVDDRFPTVKTVAGIAVSGRIEDLSSLRHTADLVFVAIGSNPVRVDFTRIRRHKSTSGSKLFECQRAQLDKATVPADSIVKTLSVIKHV